MRHKVLLTSLLLFSSMVEANVGYSYNEYPPVGRRTVDDVIKRYQPFVGPRLEQYFEKRGLLYPPKNIALFAIKSELRVELWTEENDKWHFVKQYEIEKISGKAGPKMQEGDKQVPEGIYSITLLNPNSRFHLSMKLNYPNAFDLKYARLEGRNSPGSNIFIHGKNSSTGCLAMGDYAIEELFLLAHRTGLDNIEVLISPVDPRDEKLEPSYEQPFWTQILYREIAKRSQKFICPCH